MHDAGIFSMHESSLGFVSVDKLRFRFSNELASAALNEINIMRLH